MYCLGVRSTNGNVADADGSCGAVIMAVAAVAAAVVAAVVVPVMVVIAMTPLVQVANNFPANT